MPPLNTDKPWTLAEDTWMLLMIRENTPTRVIAVKLGRSEFGVYTRASLLGVSLKPVNQSPYHRRGM